MAECQQENDEMLDEINDLNHSFDELNIEGDREPFRNIESLLETDENPMTSTPRRARKCLSDHFGSPERSNDDGPIDSSDARGTKHDLTPNSKKSNQPKPKRIVVGKPSRKELNEKRSSIESQLNASFIQQEGCEVNRALVQSCLGLDDDNTSLLTRTIKRLFPDVTVRRDKIHSITFYVNLKHNGSFSCTDSDCSIPVSDEMINIQQQLGAVEEVLKQIFEQLKLASEGDMEIGKLLADFISNSHERDKLMKIILQLNKTQMQCNDTSPTSLSAEQKEILANELKIFEKLCDIGIRSGDVTDGTDLLIPSLFKDLMSKVKEKCPMLQSIIEALMVTHISERNIHKTNEKKVLCGYHALALLLNVKNANSRNDFPLLFGILCMSYGAGKQFINTLQSIGLSLNFETIKNYLKKRLDKFDEIILEHAPVNVPVIILMDNINMYRGNKRHHRLFKALGPTMWNFTVRGAIIPNCDTVKELDKLETTQLPQRPLSSLKSNDLFIESNPEHMKKWDEAKDSYLSNLLDAGLNKVPEHEKFSSMSEVEFQSWLKKEACTNLPDPEYVMKSSSKVNNMTETTKTLMLPLSLENNATTTGTASVLEEFAKEFRIPCDHAKVVLPYDDKLKSFSIDDARKHHEFLYLLNEHKKEMEQLEKELTNIAKELDVTNEEEDEIDDTETEGECSENQEISFQKVDGKFKKIFDKLTEKMWVAQQSGDPVATLQLQQYMCVNRASWEMATDHHRSTVLHCAVQKGNYALVKSLINAGVNPNIKERCGATPLTLAVIKGDEEMVRILIENFAICRESYFTSVPGPKAIAEKLNLDNILSLIDDSLARGDKQDLEVWKMVDFRSPEVVVTQNGMPVSDKEQEGYGRNIKKCKTLVVGDQGTNKIIRGVKDKSRSAYEWAAEVPGDMHTRGYLYEVCKKTMGVGGFMSVAQHIMKRVKVTDAAFGDKKFQYQNLNRIDEAVRDVSMAYGLAAVQEFRESDMFPSKDQLHEHNLAHGNHHDLLLNLFKEWIEKHGKSNVEFQYHSQLITLFGPLREFYLACVKYGDGLGREAVWMLMLPLFAQLQKRNYWTEAFVHLVNILAAWPLYTRKLLQNNCSVSVKGRHGHNIALDEWVESFLVKPLKNYVSGHSSVNMLKLMSANLEMISSVRSIFTGHEAFNVHPSNKHKEEDPFPDQLKGMWFCLKRNFFHPKDNCMEIPALSVPGEEIGKVPARFIDVYGKGKQKVCDNFGSKLFNTFHVLCDSEQTGDMVDDEGALGDMEEQ